MKKVALISDIHGNYKALEAVLAYLETHPVSEIICLGDYVTDSPYPERIMDLLRKMQERYPCYLIRGNREQYLLQNTGNRYGWKPSSANGILYYTLQHLTNEDLRFFASLPTEQRLVLEDYPTLYLCHGTPGDLRGNVTEEEGLRERMMSKVSCRYLLGGHSHHQEISLHSGTTYINPGSVGIAIDGVGKRAQFAILTIVSKKETERGSCTAELLSVDYDAEGFLRDYAESGVDEIGMTLYKAIRKTLLTGINYFYKCIQAMEEEARRVGADSIEALPEESWKPLEERFELNV